MAEGVSIGTILQSLLLRRLQKCMHTTKRSGRFYELQWSWCTLITAALDELKSCSSQHCG